MPEAPHLLVVDDDEAVCRACHRVLSRDGFDVKASTDPSQGLQWALETDCDCILLDIKMPRMDGIQFLEGLRARNSDVPVLVMSGYPSVPDAAAAIRLGALDYIAKPFTADEIGRAVRRVLTQRSFGAPALAADLAAGGGAIRPAPEYLFFDEAWVRTEGDGSACIGAVLPGLRAEKIEAVRLPRVGQIVYQGLPLAAVTAAGRAPLSVPSPATGIVLGVNEQLADDPAALANDPCGGGWIACVATARCEEEMSFCRVRQVVLANADEASARMQGERLKALGCEVSVIRGREELRQTARDVEGRVLLLDAASFGADGPALVGQLNALAPSWKIVVLDAADGLWETAYRKHRIFYFAVAPFADNEISDILDAAFRTAEPQRPRSGQHKGRGEPLARIDVDLADGRRVCLQSAPGLLRQHEGLAGQIGHRLAEAGVSAATTPGEADLAPAVIAENTAACDRLIVLLAKDGGGLPGTLTRGLPAECAPPSASVAPRITWLSIQPDAVGGLGGLDLRTLSALAEHIVREMISCGRPLAEDQMKGTP